MIMPNQNCVIDSPFDQVDFDLAQSFFVPSISLSLAHSFLRPRSLSHSLPGRPSCLSCSSQPVD